MPSRNGYYLGGWLDEFFHRRKDKGKDIIIFVDDYYNDRGSGKTVLSLLMADYMDQTDDGLTADKCFISADRIVDAYTSKPPGSALVLDEAEVGADKYQAGSKSNRALRKIVSMGRIEQKYVVLNMPNIGFIDRDLKSLAHAWISVECRGRARVHYLGYNKYIQKDFSDHAHYIRWADIKGDRLRGIYHELTEEKRQHMAGNEGDMHVVTAKEADERAEKLAEKRAMEKRNELIKTFYETTDMTQQDIADRVGVSRDRVGDVVRGEA